MKMTFTWSARAGAVLLTVLMSAFYGSADDQTISDEQIEALVKDLVSPNKAPRTRGPSAQYPPGYDRDAQQRVLRAFHELRDLAPRSFPFLFDHFDDKRYALTADSGDVDRNYSVGELCRDILTSHLQSNIWDHKEGGTSFRRRPDEPDYIAHYKLFQPSHATKWWEERKTRSLRDLQIEVLEWVLAEETKLPEAFSDEQRERVEKRLTALRKSKTPRKAGYPFSR
jgi:hypothetical protein